MLNRALALDLYFATHGLTKHQDLLDMFDTPMEDSWTQLDGHVHDVKAASHGSNLEASKEKVLTPSSSLSSISSSSSSSILRYQPGLAEKTSQGAPTVQAAFSTLSNPRSTDDHSLDDPKKVCSMVQVLLSAQLTSPVQINGPFILLLVNGNAFQVSFKRFA